MARASRTISILLLLSTAVVVILPSPPHTVFIHPWDPLEELGVFRKATQPDHRHFTNKPFGQVPSQRTPSSQGNPIATMELAERLTMIAFIIGAVSMFIWPSI